MVWNRRSTSIPTSSNWKLRAKTNCRPTSKNLANSFNEWSGKRHRSRTNRPNQHAPPSMGAHFLFQPTILNPMKSITVYWLVLQFDANQITHGKHQAQARQALDLINGVLQREPFG